MDRLPIVITGHVDHGKSTVVGRLLADTGSLPDGKLAEIRALCERTARPFEYAFVLDALKDERAQGITIETARIFFRTARREYVILDAPGHVEFLRNMVTGASRADAALLVVDAHEGVQENSRRHGWLLGLLSVKQVVVLINKMDLVGFDRATFERLERDFRSFLASAGLDPSRFVPVSARDGDNLVSHSDRMPWYTGPTVLEALDAFQVAPEPVDAPLRLPVQDVYKFTEEGDDRRIVAGTVESGTLRTGDELVFYPSGKHTRVARLESFGGQASETFGAGQAAGFTLTDQIYVTRGEVAARAGEARPAVSTRFRASVFWLGQKPLSQEGEYLLKLGTARAPARIEAIHRVLDATTLEPIANRDAIHRHEAGEVTIALGRALAFDLPEMVAATSRFVLIDDWDVRGGGIIREALPDRQSWVREKVLVRNARWETGLVPAADRAARHGQHPALLLVTGPAHDAADRKALAKELEARLFQEGRLVYYLGMASVLYGVDADLDRARAHRAEHMRRLAEIANILLEAGMIVLVTAAELTSEDLDLITTGVEPERLRVAWVGPEGSAAVRPDALVDPSQGPEEGIRRLRVLLSEMDAIPPAVSLAGVEPGVIWLTGLPGSGKSTIADHVAEQLRAAGRRVERLDGDQVRALFPGTGFDREAREEHLRRIGYLASRLEAHGTFVVASFVSPYRESRDFVRSLCRRFVEVWVNTPLEECERRDPKGLYQKARSGEISRFTGIDDPYQPPVAAELVIDTTRLTAGEAARRVLDLLANGAREQ